MFGYVSTGNDSFAGYLTVDGVPIDPSDATTVAYSDIVFVAITEVSLCERALSSSYNDLMKEFTSVSIANHHGWEAGLPGMRLSMYNVVRYDSEKPDRNYPAVAFNFNFEPSEWMSPWTMLDYMDEIVPVLDLFGITRKDRYLNNQKNPLDGFQVYFDIVNPDYTVASLVTTFLPTIDRAHRQVVRNLTSITEEQSRIEERSVAVHFDFPTEVRVACERYLIYFMDFLHDVGIEATADLRHDAGGVLFSVTPNNKNEALIHIREAVSVYLRLPTSPALHVPVSPMADMDVQRLAMTINRLNGDLAIAGVMIQQQDALIAQKDIVIAQKDIVIAQQPRIIDSQILITSIQKDDEDEEPLIGDTVLIKPFEWEFLKIDLPTILRRLRHRFGKKD